MTLRMAAEQMTTVDSVRAMGGCGCITEQDPPEDELNLIIDNVSDAMARLSGMYVRGRAQYIARPCREYCVCQCACCGMDAIPLGDRDPVIDEVWINGWQLEESEYALHSTITGWNLVRYRSADDIAFNRRPRDWPSWQDRWRDWTSTTDTPTFAVIYTMGVHIDDVYIERAANELVCDLISEEGRRATSLPASTVGASMGGVQVSVSSDRISAITERLDRITAGELGPAFTRFMGMFAPRGRGFSAVWAPELLGGWQLNPEHYVAPVVIEPHTIAVGIAGETSST